ncbi:MAG TPA: glycosyltransferase [Streptosporangiaceae bacterium]|nr:glycosyltransferase [Streptosporangiaceae bacterium]
MDDQVTVVIATRGRRPELLRTLDRLHRLAERPPVIVVDNASSDGSAAAVREHFPAVTLRVLAGNAGAAARNAGVALAATPYVAFSDDDSWWEPGALARAAAALDADPRLGLIAARTLVGPAREPDPVNALMDGSPLRDGGTAEVLGFMACASIVRKEAFLGAGGFSPLLFFIGEERLLSYDLAAAGWARRYLPDVVAVHEPSAIRPASHLRRRAERRNLLLTAWLRRPVPVALAETLRLARDAVRDPDDRAALAAATRKLPAALRSRRRLPAEVERKVRVLAAAHGGQW